MTPATHYHKETAETLFATLVEAAGLPLNRRYATLRQVLTVVAEQQTEQVPLAFVGLLSRVDYLVRSRRLSAELGFAIGQTRHALCSPRSNLRRATDEVRRQAWPHHLEAVCRFVSALFGEAPIPRELCQRFPRRKVSRDWVRADLHSLRVVVERWNAETIVARAADSALEMTIDYGRSNPYLTQHGELDWGYLSGLLRTGQQLNLVDVRMDGGRLLPEVIVVEPDLLVDVSSVCGCMETYTESPRVLLVSRLKPQVNTVPILLGNLAGQFLDETIHGEHRDYAESMKDHFARHPLAFATCPELADAQKARDFHAQARLQQRQIERLVGQDLPEAVPEFRRESSLLEPSFFCETLGLQGRMDLLQPGNNLIVEQKSGKGEWTPMGAAGYSQDVPKAKEPHYAQLLLYRAMLQYGLRQPARSLGNLFLLYSRYAKGLLRLGGAPALLHRALRLRNEIAVQERVLAEEGWGVLDGLTPEALNTKGAKGALWQQYTRPELERLLGPVRDASPLERAYVLRLLRFVSMEQMLARTGTGSQHPGFAGKWLLTLEEKLAMGDILAGLSLTELRQQGRNVTEVVLDADNAPTEENGAESAPTNFRKGDVVVVYGYEKGREPDVCAQMVMRGTIASLSTHRLTIRLRNPQTDPQVFRLGKNDRWAVEHDLYESSAGSLYRGLHAFLNAPEERRQLLLMQRRPQVDETLTLAGDYGDFNPLVLRAKQSRDAFLVIGPPGTGKTSFALMNILREELLQADASVLLTAFTNRAVDEICDKLDEAGIDYLRLGSELAASPACRPHLLSRRVDACRRVEDVLRLLRGVRVVCATTASMCASGLQMLSVRRFSLAIVDEASQLLEPHLLPLLSATTEEGKPAIRRFCLIGDHKQLPAVVSQNESQSRVDEPALRAIGLTDCRRSLFERWLVGWGQSSRHVFMLTRQGRMHRDIALFPSRYFYGDRLEVASERQTAVAREPRMLFVDVRPASDVCTATHTGDEPATSTPMREVEGEARLAASIVVDTWRRYGPDFDECQTVGVIVPYRNQISAVRKWLPETLAGITIDTVERFQGSQRDVIVYCFSVSQRHQLQFLTSTVFEEEGQVIDRKLNVAMTRAREHLYMLGNVPLLRENLTFARLVAWMSERRCLVSAEDYLSRHPFTP